jgi:hypothetical protein
MKTFSPRNMKIQGFRFFAFRGLWPLVGVWLFLAGCQWPTAYYVRDNVFPQDTGAKIALSPVLLPAYVVLAVTDIMVVNPVRGARNVPSVVEDIWDWEKQNPWIGKGVLLPIKFVAIPAAAIGTVMFSEQFIKESTAFEEK